MDEIYVTYVDDEHVDNHDYDDTTDDDHDNNNVPAWSGLGPVRVQSGSGPDFVPFWGPLYYRIFPKIRPQFLLIFIGCYNEKCPKICKIWLFSYNPELQLKILFQLRWQKNF